ncbi:hypothetical protein [Clostridium estertheticum]|uniref:hypothetical protein n=1 Tax=Clostridium estertheticum TaxID=238834 RepID=UPI001C0B3D5E|nr:hypothetical protein [Clostridium estertheticum]MBU3202493.1 hypothetical protein [Clostridium estertheticum]
MENREYINCKIQVKEAWINTGAGGLMLEQPIKGFKRKACGVNNLQNSPNNCREQSRIMS